MGITLKDRLFLIAAIIIAVAVVVLLNGCGGSRPSLEPEEHNKYIWPEPPETARIEYVKSVQSHSDLLRTKGLWRRVVGFFAGPPDSQISRPFALAVHPEGLVVTDPGRAGAHFYNWRRGRYHFMPGLPSPVGAAVLPDGSILISDSRLAVVRRYSAEGKKLDDFVPPGILARPAGIAVLDGKVFVVDVTQHQVAVFNASGKQLRRIGGHGAEGGTFNFPTHIAIDGDGTLLVTDSMNFRVQKITAGGVFLSAFGSIGAAPGHFSKPKGIAGDGNGNVIVVEGLYDSLQFFNREGELLMSLGSAGSNPGEFWLPAGLAFDAEAELLFVADSYNHRVQVFHLISAQGMGEGK
jgi:hypothetical protein